jgi:hypothetical protein
MAKKKDQSGFFIGIIIVFALLSAAWQWAKENWPILAAIGTFILFILIIRSYKKRKARRQWVNYLKEKYNDNYVVEMILDGKFWRGQTSEMLIDSLGSPADKDSLVLKTKTKTTWKYGHKHSNQYRLRIFLENNVVTGWEQKT